MERYLLVRKQPAFCDLIAPVSLWNVWVCNHFTNSILTMRHYRELGRASDWFEICFNQSEALSRYGYRWYVISMEFLCLVLRCHFERKLAVVSQNISYFLKTHYLVLLIRSYTYNKESHSRTQEQGSQHISPVMPTIKYSWQSAQYTQEDETH